MVSTDRVPSLPVVTTKPLVVRFEMRERFITLVPVNVFASASKVDEAKVQVLVEKV